MLLHLRVTVPPDRTDAVREVFARSPGTAHLAVLPGAATQPAGDLVLDPIRESFRSHVTGRTHRPMLEVRQAELGNAAGMIGVADLARSQ